MIKICFTCTVHSYNSAHIILSYHLNTKCMYMICMVYRSSSTLIKSFISARLSLYWVLTMFFLTLLPADCSNKYSFLYNISILEDSVSGIQYYINSSILDIILSSRKRLLYHIALLMLV